MNENKIKKIYEKSKKKKREIERGHNYWEALFLSFAIATILFSLNIINKKVINKETISWVYLIEVGVLLFLIFFSNKKSENRLLAIFLKEEKCKSLKKAKELLSKKE